MKRPFEARVLIFLLFILSVNALYGGVFLIIQPDGSLLGIDAEWFENMLFKNFLFPGILLILFLGIFPFISLVGLFSKRKFKKFNTLNFFPEKHWGWTYALYTGIITNIWIIVQQLFIGYFILQPIIAALGMLIIIATLLPRVQKYYSTETNLI